jgi:predicted dehydrogenase
VRGRAFHQGAPLLPGNDQVEDYAVGTLALEDGATAQLACSWRLHAGREAIISATFYGTDGGVSFRNVGGSFYDFAAERFRGTETELLTDAPEEWGGRAAAQWATRLANGDRFCGEAERLVEAARIIDRLYAAPPLAG